MINSLSSGLIFAIFCALVGAGCGTAAAPEDSAELGTAREPGSGCNVSTTGQCWVDTVGNSGVECQIWNSTTNSFGSAAVWSSFFTLPNDFGYGNDENNATVQYPDLNGDGMPDICGRNSNGLYCALSNGTSFGSVSLWSSEFSDANGWNGSDDNWATIQFADVNGDGRADVCGRGSAGVNCALSNGSTFGTPSIWASAFSNTNGWNSSAEYYGTIQFPDLNGDGKADVCGRGSGGINCALSTGSLFGSVSIWSSAFSNANGWGGSTVWPTIQFPYLTNDYVSPGKGWASVCGYNGTSIECAFNNAPSSDFATATAWWTGTVSEPNTLQFEDMAGSNDPGFEAVDSHVTVAYESVGGPGFTVASDASGTGNQTSTFLSLVRGASPACTNGTLVRRLPTRYPFISN